MMAEFFRVPKRAGSSPPSPQLDLPPRVFMATAMHSWASAEMEPKDIAPVLNLLTMESTLSTSSKGIGVSRYCISIRPRRVWGLEASSTRAVYSLKSL